MNNTIYLDMRMEDIEDYIQALNDLLYGDAITKENFIKLLKLYASLEKYVSREE